MDSIDATIVITSINRELLKLCRLFIPQDAPVLVIDGSHGCWGLRAITHVIDTVPAEHIILLDEDAFIIDFQKLKRLLAWVIDHGLACVGMCDGGMVLTRRNNPNAFNTFFNIIDLTQIRREWAKSTCHSNRWDAWARRDLWPPSHVLTPSIPYSFDYIEHYYRFYFWLRATGLPVDWLSATTHVDGISTLLIDREDKPFLLHTWYGRAFGRHAGHTARIVRAAQWVARERQSRPR